MSTIHFISGKTQEVTVDDVTKLIDKLKYSGIRMMVDRRESSTLVIPLNSTTIECIEVPAEYIKKEEPEPTVEKITVGDKEEDKPKKSDEEKYQEVMDEMIAKSNCTHQNQDIYKQETSNGTRYFPVCSFCGKRERYVKADSLSDEQKENAKEWKD